MEMIKMNSLSPRKKRRFVVLSSILIGLLLLTVVYLHFNNLHTTRLVMGAQLYQQFTENQEETKMNETSIKEKYFRPSKLPILNNIDFRLDFLYPLFRKNPSEITLPNYLMKTPIDTIINYFSILREAANPQPETKTGCGTLGNAIIPYPAAYNFLLSTYQEKLNYNQYFKSFENILHINLIKLKEVPTDKKHPNSLRYFVEIETIEGSEKQLGYFAYYYGYLYIIKEGSQYRISDFELYGENYLCAPYHGWQYSAEAVIDFKYGNWCHLVEERYPTQQDGYVKKIQFKGTDGNNYLIEFFQLTNGTDLEIAQYKRNVNGEWDLIRLDPEKCLEDN